MNKPNWDMDISLTQFKRVLLHAGDPRFDLLFARVLSRVPFREVFHEYVTPRQFKRHFLKVRRLLNADLLGAGRLEFWDWLYKRLQKKR